MSKNETTVSPELKLFLVTNNAPFAATFVAATTTLEAFVLWRMSVRDAAPASHPSRVLVIPVPMGFNNPGLVDWHLLESGAAAAEEYSFYFESLVTMAIEAAAHEQTRDDDVLRDAAIDASATP